jgi:serine/threonine protein kinase
MLDIEIVEYHQYCPPGVQRVIASGTSSWIGVVDESTVLKYALQPGGDTSRLEIERKILTIVGEHSHIIRLKSFSDVGLYLERAVNGTLYKYLAESDHSTISIQQRLLWCRELTLAVVHVHSRRVIHCDIQPSNILLDENFHLKLADFQGNYLSEDGQVILEGGSAEPCRFFCPRDDPFEASVKTDIFALGCTIYFIMTGHCVFPDIIDGEEGWADKVRDRFEQGQFPEDSHACSDIVLKCWKQQYEETTMVLQDVEAVGKRFKLD